MLDRDDEKSGAFDPESEFDLFEKTEYEPEEYDPEAEFRDPNSDTITIPEVETDESDVPSELLKTFWATVIVVNAAVLFVSVGVMIIGFLGRFRDGGVLIVGGLALFGFAYRRYRAFRDSDTEYEPLDSDDDSATADEPDAETGPTETVSNVESKDEDRDCDE
ncbi:DUF7322 domain-containing protein [Natrialbaceae archaeon AArc-T1-2]|uniref:DUF7322 domain-containing protein n=1 Tax=Natrialbaceae archaeon AArc-T1-2 TaxID=3053904 RepID=UPI00255AAFE6|nr:hypothetical protein [Natrialbaceae archaeon AArc-T1-2]WIV67622.1 hypothetical protein QQ977_02510 [Natrialbaceae archaeon AArc-T1-2]